MAVNFTQKLATYNTTSALLDGSYLDLQNSTNLEGTTIVDADLFVMQDGGSTGTANTGKIQALDIKEYIAESLGGDITSVALTADSETAACTAASGDVSFDIEGGTNVATDTNTNKVTINVATATTNALGVASFSSSDFDVTTGAVSVKDNSITLAYMASGTDGNIISYDASGNPVAVATGTATHVLTSAGAGAPPTFSAIPDQLPDNAVTLAKMASGTDGNIISYDASGDPVAVATGTATHVLTSAGAGAPPTFSALPSSTWSISDGTTTNSAFATGESFVYTGGDSITATLADGGATTTLTIDLDESISVDTAITGTVGAKALWSACTDVISIGHSDGSVTIAGDLQVSGTTITTATETLEIADNTMVLNAGHTGDTADSGFVFEQGSTGVNKVLFFDVAAAQSADTTARFVVSDNASAAVGGTYQADVHLCRIDNASINTSSTEVPVGHMQYHAGELYLRVEDS